MMASQFSAPVIIMGDNFSSDVQSPAFFERWSKDFYAKAYEIIHAHGKKVAVHVDGKLKGAIKMMKDIGADCIDAVTPGSVGGCTPAEARQEAGNDLILSGGIPNELWYDYSDLADFDKAVKDWLALKEVSPALIMAAGDQVPPGAQEDRILRLTQLVDEYGWY
jgi:uroporphyrinogen-III decarboxylase